MSQAGFYRNDDNSLCYVDEQGLEYNPNPNVDPAKAYAAGVKYIQDGDGTYYYHNVNALLSAATTSSNQPSPLPPGWAEYVDPDSGRTYYRHDASGTSQWERPQMPSSGESQASPLPPGWAEYVDPDSGRTYYRHEASGTSQFERPQMPSSATADSNAGTSQLPPGWAEYVDPDSGRTYYRHEASGTSQFERPQMPSSGESQAQENNGESTVVEETPLPAGWSQHSTPSGRTYYKCDVTNKSQFDRPGPGDAVEVKPKPEEQTKLQEDAAKAETSKEEVSSKEKGPLPPGWSEHVHPSSGRTFYRNDVTNRSQWDRPEMPKTSETSESKPEPSDAGQASTSADNTAASTEAETAKQQETDKTEETKEESTAEKGPLPPGWSEHVHPSSGKTFYRNDVTNRSQWDRPEMPTTSESKTQEAAETQQPSSAKSAEEATNSTSSTQDETTTQQEAVKAAETKEASTVEKSPLPPGWSELVHPSTGKTFYRNDVTNRSQWDRPQMPDTTSEAKPEDAKPQQSSDAAANSPLQQAETTPNQEVAKVETPNVSVPQQGTIEAIANQAKPAAAESSENVAARAQDEAAQKAEAQAKFAKIAAFMQGGAPSAEPSQATTAASSSQSSERSDKSNGEITEATVPVDDEDDDDDDSTEEEEDDDDDDSDEEDSDEDSDDDDEDSEEDSDEDSDDSSIGDIDENNLLAMPPKPVAPPAAVATQPEPEPEPEEEEIPKENTGDPLDDSEYWPYEDSESEEEEEEPLPPGWAVEVKWGMNLYVNKAKGIATYFRPTAESEKEMKHPSEATDGKATEEEEADSPSATTSTPGTDKQSATNEPPKEAAPVEVAQKIEPAAAPTTPPETPKEATVEAVQKHVTSKQEESKSEQPKPLTAAVNVVASVPQVTEIAKRPLVEQTVETPVNPAPTAATLQKPEKPKPVESQSAEETKSNSAPCQAPQKTNPTLEVPPSGVDAQPTSQEVSTDSKDSNETAVNPQQSPCSPTKTTDEKPESHETHAEKETSAPAETPERPTNTARDGSKTPNLLSASQLKEQIRLFVAAGGNLNDILPSNVEVQPRRPSEGHEKSAETDEKPLARVPHKGSRRRSNEKDDLGRSGSSHSRSRDKKDDLARSGSSHSRSRDKKKDELAGGSSHSRSRDKKKDELAGGSSHSRSRGRDDLGKSGSSHTSTRSRDKKDELAGRSAHSRSRDKKDELAGGSSHSRSRDKLASRSSPTRTSMEKEPSKRLGRPSMEKEPSKRFGRPSMEKEPSKRFGRSAQLGEDKDKRMRSPVRRTASNRDSEKRPSHSPKSPRKPPVLPNDEAGASGDPNAPVGGRARPRRLPERTMSEGGPRRGRPGRSPVRRTPSGDSIYSANEIDDGEEDDDVTVRSSNKSPASSRSPVRSTARSPRPGRVPAAHMSYTVPDNNVSYNGNMSYTVPDNNNNMSYNGNMSYTVPDNNNMNYNGNMSYNVPDGHMSYNNMANGHMSYNVGDANQGVDRVRRPASRSQENLRKRSHSHAPRQRHSSRGDRADRREMFRRQRSARTQKEESNGQKVAAMCGEGLVF